MDTKCRAGQFTPLVWVSMQAFKEGVNIFTVSGPQNSGSPQNAGFHVMGQV